MSIHPHLLLGLRKVVRDIELRRSVRCGFLSEQDYARFRHIVELSGLSRDTLGDARFRRAHQIAVAKAVSLAPLNFLVEPVRDNRRIVVGYEFGFATDEMARSFYALVMAALCASGVV